MKVNNLTQRSFIKIHLLKNQIYAPFNIYKIDLNNTILEIKKALKVIFVYNKHKKKILFLGFPFKKDVHNQINHSFKTKNYHKNFFLTNEHSLKKNFDLVVLNLFRRII